jgi:hypothetical protein
MPGGQPASLPRDHKILSDHATIVLRGTEREDFGMKNRLASAFIALALALLAADLVWVLPRLTPLLATLRASPGAVLLASALGLLVAAGLLRSHPGA